MENKKESYFYSDEAKRLLAEAKEHMELAITAMDMFNKGMEKDLETPDLDEIEM